jgi:hypothetical protein
MADLEKGETLQQSPALMKIGEESIAALLSAYPLRK